MEFEGVNLLPGKDYKPYDVCCHSIPNHQGRKNMYSTSCAAKLAMEEPHLECLKCKGLKLSKKEDTIEDKLADERNPKTKECRTCLTLIGKAANYCATCMQDR